MKRLILAVALSAAAWSSILYPHELRNVARAVAEISAVRR